MIEIEADGVGPQSFSGVGCFSRIGAEVPGIDF